MTAKLDPLVNGLPVVQDFRMFCDLEDEVFEEESGEQQTMDSFPRLPPSSVSKAPKLRPFRNLYSYQEEYWFDEEDQVYERRKPTMRSVVCHPASSVLNTTKLEFFRRPDSQNGNISEVADFCRDSIVREKEREYFQHARSPTLMHSTSNEQVLSWRFITQTLYDVDYERCQQWNLFYQQWWSILQQWWICNHIPRTLDDGDLEMLKVKESKQRQVLCSMYTLPTYLQSWFAEHFPRTCDNVDLEKFETMKSEDSKCSNSSRSDPTSRDLMSSSFPSRIKGNASETNEKFSFRHNLESRRDKDTRNPKNGKRVFYHREVQVRCSPIRRSSKKSDRTRSRSRACQNDRTNWNAGRSNRHGRSPMFRSPMKRSPERYESFDSRSSQGDHACR